MSAEERARLAALISKGKSPARQLLKADVSEGGDGWSDSRIVTALETSASMVFRVRKQWVEEGFETVLSRKQRATPAALARIFDGETEAKLIVLACSQPPKGRARWTLRLLEEEVERASDTTIKRTLKPHRREQWVIPPKANAAFGAALEDILAVYTRPHDPEAGSITPDVQSIPANSIGPKRPSTLERLSYASIAPRASETLYATMILGKGSLLSQCVWVGSLKRLRFQNGTPPLHRRSYFCERRLCDRFLTFHSQILLESHPSSYTCEVVPRTTAIAESALLIKAARFDGIRISRVWRQRFLRLSRPLIDRIDNFTARFVEWYTRYALPPARTKKEQKSTFTLCLFSRFSVHIACARLGDEPGFSKRARPNHADPQAK